MFVLSSRTQKTKGATQKMIEHVEFKGHNFQQIILIPMEANILPLIGDRLYSYGTDVYKNVSKKTQLQKQKLLISHSYDVDLVLSVNNINLTFKITVIYLKDMEIMETIQEASSASFLDIYH